MITLTVGSLFSGIGGFDLGLERAGMNVLWQVEIDDFCNKVLAKHWPDVERFRDVKEVGKHNLQPVDLICGGFPCQPFSNAGKRRGKSDDRYLWPEMLRVIRELKPRWIIGENVAGFINMELENAFADLETEGYQVEAFVLPAFGIGAPHKRERIWIVAYAYNYKSQQPQCYYLSREGASKSRFSPELGASNRSTNGHTSQRIKLPGRITKTMDKGLEGVFGGFCQWELEPDLGRMAYGIPNRLDRLRGLGNAVVPQIPEILGQVILEIERQYEPI